MTGVAERRTLRTGGRAAALILFGAAICAPVSAQERAPRTGDVAVGGRVEPGGAIGSQPAVPADTPAGSQPAVPAGTPFGPLPGDLQEALSREIARLRAEIDEIARLRRWQADMLRIARTNPAEARRLRRPMATCRASVLAPLCAGLGDLFVETEAPAGATAPQLPPPAGPDRKEDTE